MAKKTTKTTAKKTMAKKVVKKPIKKAVKAPVVPETVNEPTVEAAAVEAPKNVLKELLMIYNSVSPSRRRWIKNRNLLRNGWKEFFIALEQASGRNGLRAELLDMNWHKVADKAGVKGLVNKLPEEITIVDSYADAPVMTIEPVTPDQKDARIAELESKLAYSIGNEEYMTAEYKKVVAELAVYKEKSATIEETDVTEDSTDEKTTSEKAGETPETEEPAAS